MSFQPVIFGTGLSGWRLLQKTYDAQLATFQKTGETARSIDQLRTNAPTIKSAESLIEDFSTFSAALTAFGLSDDAKNKFFIRKILTEDPSEAASLSARLADKKYQRMGQFFGYYNEKPIQMDTEKTEVLVEKYVKQKFAIDVGLQNDRYRAALYAQDTLAELADSEISNNAKIYRILGDPPLREVVLTAIGLPSEINNIDIDRQKQEVEKKLNKIFGTHNINEIGKNENQQKLIDYYIVRSEQLNSNQNSYNTALQLIQNIRY